MPIRTAPISRREYESRAGPNLGRPSPFKPDLRPVVAAGLSCLAKDYAARPFLVRATLGRLSISREAAVYAALRGATGVPRFLGRIDPYAILIERIPGRDARDVPPGVLDAGFFARLETVVRGLHERGVVHGDLRQRRNVILGPDGAPFVVDFASGIRLPPGSALLRLLAGTDLSGVAKLKERHAPEALTPEDRRRLGWHRFRPLRARRLAARRSKRCSAESGLGRRTAR